MCAGVEEEGERQEIGVFVYFCICVFVYLCICVGENQETYVKTLANETCKALEYEHLAWAAVGRDEEMVEDIQYVGLEGLSIGVDFHPVECDDRLVVSVIITIDTVIGIIDHHHD